MGDLLHLFPALSDVRKHHPDIKVDWLVEDSFSAVPAWHPIVDRVITVATRRWRSLSWKNITEFSAFVKTLRHHKYDMVIDAQGLMKSAGLSVFARRNKGALRVGFSKHSIKESFAAKFYHQQIEVPRQQHAISRLRQLFAHTFGYEIDNASTLDYQINLSAKKPDALNARTIFFLHGTTWPSKHLPDQIWRDLLDLVIDDGYQVKLCWGNESERKRAQWIAQDRVDVHVLPKLGLQDLAMQISGAAGAISVDTGLGHLAAALNVPATSVYGSTDATLTGALGEAQIQLQTDYPCSPCMLKKCNKVTQQVTIPPCYQTLSAADIWQGLYEQIA